MRAPKVTTKNHSGIAKHASLPSGRVSSSEELARCFSEVVRTLVSATLVDIRGWEMKRHCGTDLDARDEFWVHNIMRIIPEIWDIQARISNTAPSFTWRTKPRHSGWYHNPISQVEHYFSFVTNPDSCHIPFGFWASTQYMTEDFYFG